MRNTELHSTLITGHCGLTKHLRTICKSSTSACSMCQHEEETVSHFLGQCLGAYLLLNLEGNIFRIITTLLTISSTPSSSTPSYLNYSCQFCNQHQSSLVTYLYSTFIICEAWYNCIVYKDQWVKYKIFKPEYCTCFS